jgi:hypothetical protein
MVGGTVWVSQNLEVHAKRLIFFSTKTQTENSPTSTPCVIRSLRTSSWRTYLPKRPKP